MTEMLLLFLFVSFVCVKKTKFRHIFDISKGGRKVLVQETQKIQQNLYKNQKLAFVTYSKNLTPAL